jgi:hypothetical protein
MNTARELTSRLAELLHREQAAMADFLVALADFDRTRHWETLGYKSLFAFLRRELKLSAGAAQYRKTAAELVQKYPEVEGALRSGDLCLSSVIELAKVLTPENAREVLPRFFGLSSRDAAFVAASIRPVENPPVREFLVTPVRTEAAAHPTAAAEIASPPQPASQETVLFRAPERNVPVRGRPSPAPARATPAPPAMTVEPLDAELARVHMTVEIDHVDGFALGADTTVERCRLLCRGHQDLSARQLYGDDLMNRYTRQRPRTHSPRIGQPSGTTSTEMPGWRVRSIAAYSSIRSRHRLPQAGGSTRSSDATCGEVQAGSPATVTWKTGAATTAPTRAGRRPSPRPPAPTRDPASASSSGGG